MGSLYRMVSFLKFSAILGFVGYFVAWEFLEAGALRTVESGVDVSTVLLHIAGVIGLGMLGIGLRNFAAVTVAVWKATRE